MAGKFEIYTDKAGEYRFRLVASNGQTVLSSEGYTTKAAAANGIESVKKNAEDKAMFIPLTTEGGKFRFNLKARNNQVIGVSQLYSSAAARDNGIDAVARAAKDAEVVDLTAAS